MRTLSGHWCFVLTMPLDKIITSLLGLLGKGAEMVPLLQACKVSCLNLRDCQVKLNKHT